MASANTTRAVAEVGWVLPSRALGGSHTPPSALRNTVITHSNIVSSTPAPFPTVTVVMLPFQPRTPTNLNCASPSLPHTPRLGARTPDPYPTGLFLNIHMFYSTKTILRPHWENDKCGMMFHVTGLRVVLN